VGKVQQQYLMTSELQKITINYIVYFHSPGGVTLSEYAQWQAEMRNSLQQQELEFMREIQRKKYDNHESLYFRY